MAGRYAVIMAGGKGERFWPLSTPKHPKQLLALVGDKPLIAQAVDRLDGFISPENVFVVTNADLIEATQKAAPMLPLENVVGEPIGREVARLGNTIHPSRALVLPSDQQAAHLVGVARPGHLLQLVQHRRGEPESGRHAGQFLVHRIGRPKKNRRASCPAFLGGFLCVYSVRTDLARRATMFPDNNNNFQRDTNGS